jgi:lipoprotein NlpD
MPLRNHILTLYLIIVVLSGCTSYVNAPVDTRRTAPEPQAKIVQPPGVTAQPHHAVATGYVVRRGDTLYSIAWQQGLEVSELARINGIRPPYTIYAGQRLKVRPGPVPQATPLARAAPLRATPLPKPVPVPASPTQARPATAPAAAATPTPAPMPAAAHNAGSPAYDGKWVWPTRGKLLRGYQENTNGKKGIDISGHHGQPVNAAAGGKVVYVGSGLVGYGRLIIIKHNESLLSAYGHNSKLLVAEGDHVRAGQLIANMGSSGTNRTALYFEIRKDGKPVDPVQYLPKL